METRTIIWIGVGAAVLIGGGLYINSRRWNRPAPTAKDVARGYQVFWATAEHDIFSHAMTWGGGDPNFWQARVLDLNKAIASAKALGADKTLTWDQTLERVFDSRHCYLESNGVQYPDTITADLFSIGAFCGYGGTYGVDNAQATRDWYRFIYALKSAAVAAGKLPAKDLADDVADTMKAFKDPKRNPKRIPYLDLPGAYDPGALPPPSPELPPSPSPPPSPKPSELEDLGVQDFGVYKVHRFRRGEGGALVWLLHDHGGSLDDFLATLPSGPGTFFVVSVGPSWIANPDGIPETQAVQLAARAADMQTLQALMHGGDPRPWVVAGIGQGGQVAYHLATASGGDLEDNRAPNVVVPAAAVLTKAPAFPAKRTTRIRAVSALGGTGPDSIASESATYATAKIFAGAGYDVSFVTKKGVSVNSAAALAPVVRQVVDDELGQKTV